MVEMSGGSIPPNATNCFNVSFRFERGWDFGSGCALCIMLKHIKRNLGGQLCPPQHNYSIIKTMEVIKVKNYINIEMMTDKLVQILTDERNSFSEDPNYSAIEQEFNNDYIYQYAEELACKFNESMRKYLNSKDHKLIGNFNNVDYDYPAFINGEIEYDHPLVDAMIKRLNAGDESEQSQKDRDWLVEWFFDTFGTYGISYNFGDMISEWIYEEEE